MLYQSILGAIALFAGLSSANPFSLTALVEHGNKTPHLQNAVINAAGQAFWIGLAKPASFCPFDPLGALCQSLPGNETLFAGFDGVLSMWVNVPGGEAVYVAPDGTIAFTAPHSAFEPPGSYTSGFTNSTIGPHHHRKTVYSWETPGNKKYSGILACPKPQPIGSTSKTPLFQLYARTPGFKEKKCTKLFGLLEHDKSSSAFNAWEYT